MVALLFFFCYNELSVFFIFWFKVFYYGFYEVCNIEIYSQDIGYKEQEVNIIFKFWIQGFVDYVLYRVKDNYWLI